MRKRKTPAVPAGKDTFHVLAEGDRNLSTKGAAPHALNVAQRLAEQAPDEITYTVVRRSLFGPAATLYRVDRIEDGTVLTTTISNDD